MKKRLLIIITILFIIFPMFANLSIYTNASDSDTPPYADKVKAVLLNANYDFSLETTESEYLEMLDYLGTIGLNTLILNTSSDGNVYYSSDIDTLNDDVYPVDSMISYAKKCGFSVYLIIDLKLALNNSDTFYSTPESASHNISGIISRNAPDGIIFDNITFEKSAEYYSEYLEYGGGIGFDNYIKEISAKTINNAISSVNSDGNTKIAFTQLLDNSTTFEYINKNDISHDFVICNDDTEISNQNDALFNIDNASLQDNSADLLTNTIIETETKENCLGIVFTSYEKLKQGGESIDTVKKYFSNTLDTQTLGNELSVSTPSQENFSTKESSIILSGTFDPNFKLTINDEEIDTAGQSSFSIEKPLEVGVNTFTIKNNSTSKTFTITRNVNIFNASTLTPNADVTVDGTNTLNVSVYAYPGSNVTATLNSVTINLQQTQTADSLGNYLYQGTFTMPPGVENQAQNLGRITLNGSYSGSSESLSGANVTVAAAAPSAPPVISEKPITSDVISANPGNSVTNPNGTANGTVVKITTNNATVYPSGATDKIPVPTQMKLASNTIDFLSKTATYEGIDYYITKSGRRVKTEYATLLSENTISSNNISANCAYTAGNNTVIKLNQDYKTPYCIIYTPIEFKNNNYGDWGDYFLDSFSPSTISIVFDYCTAASGGFNFPENSLFTSSSWRLVTIDGVQKVCLDLTLAKAGHYYGTTVSYDSEGCIVFSFNGPETSLKGTVIVIDPGHGYISNGEYDPGALGSGSSQEASVNQAVSILLEQKLKAAGATVIRLKTESTPYSTEARSEVAREYDPDLYISLHCNGSTSTRAQGSSTYYFQPFSYPLAKYVDEALAKFYTDEIYGTNKSEGTFFDYFFVTTQPDFPSILVELGYITNSQEASVLTNPAYQDKIAQALMNGIANYLGSNK